MSVMGAAEATRRGRGGLGEGSTSAWSTFGSTRWREGVKHAVDFSTRRKSKTMRFSRTNRRPKRPSGGRASGIALHSYRPTCAEDLAKSRRHRGARESEILRE